MALGRHHTPMPAGGASTPSVHIDLRMDDYGVLPKALSDATVDAATLTPTLHNPSGKIWSLSRRRELLTAASRNGVLIIEDDAYGPLVDISLRPGTGRNSFG